MLSVVIGSKTFRLLAALLCLLLGVGLFVEHTDPWQSDVSRALWNVGHVVLFAVLTLLVAPSLRHLPPKQHTLTVLLAVLLLGVLIEGLQAQIGRQASLWDLYNNLAGASLALLLLAKPQCQPRLQRGRYLIAIALLAISLSPLALLLSNQLLARWQLPDLLRFDARFVPPLSGSADIRYHQHYADIRFGTERYSSFKLAKFHPDWRGWQGLVIELENLEAEPFSLSCRVHDRWHNNDYRDRFNRSQLLQPGRQQLRFHLDEVIGAVAHRSFDLTQVAGLSCFTISEQRQHQLRLYRIYLQ